MFGIQLNEFDELLQECVDLNLKIENLKEKEKILIENLGPIGAARLPGDDTAENLLETLYDSWRLKESLREKTKVLEDQICKAALRQSPPDVQELNASRTPEAGQETSDVSIEQENSYNPVRSRSVGVSKRVLLSRIPRRRTKRLRSSSSNWQLNLINQILMGRAVET